MKFSQSILYLLGCLLFAGVAFGDNPYVKPNNSVISINGKVASVSADRFELDYGEGSVTVEMDDGDRDADAYKLMKGDRVTVHGFIDRDLYESTKIEAGSVYVKNLGTTFFASSLDEEDSIYGWYLSAADPIDDSSIIYGTVDTVSAKTFTVKTGEVSMTVDTSQMSFNPLDDEGYLRLEPGDYIRVDGKLTGSFFKDKKLMADNIIAYGDRTKKKKDTSH